MGLIEKIKQEASGKKININTTEESEIEHILNNLFYLPKNIEKETEFIKSVMTRGSDSQERKGLHASALLVSDDVFCYRQQILSLFYKQKQGEQNSVGLMRIFEEGNAIHEKWQRLFIRGGLAEPLDCDLTQFNADFDLQFTPDIIARINGAESVVEIKSVNTYKYKEMEHHPTGRKQCKLYMYLTGIKKGFVLMDDKNTQDFKVRCYEPDFTEIQFVISRLEKIQYYKHRFEDKKKLVKRHDNCTGYNCKMAESCPMREVCYGKDKTRI